MTDLDDLENLMLAAAVEVSTSRSRRTHLDWVLAIQNAAPALLRELRALRAVLEAIDPLEPSLRSAERSSAPAFLHGLCMEAPDIAKLLAALAKAKEARP